MTVLSPKTVLGTISTTYTKNKGSFKQKRIWNTKNGYTVSLINVKHKDLRTKAAKAIAALEDVRELNLVEYTDGTRSLNVNVAK